ncbi:MAG: sulfatase-like hydrolase/transferase [Planctomycetota bacterium]
MNSHNDSRSGLLASNALIALGVLVIAGALLGQILGLGQGKTFWSKQFLVALGGSVIVILGLSVAPARRQRMLDAWRAYPPVTIGEAVLLGAWIGLVSGFAESLHRETWGWLRTSVSNLMEDRIWIPAATYLLLFSAIGFVLGLIGMIWRGAMRRPLVLFVCVLIGAWGQFLLHKRLDGSAVLVLSAGFAAQFARHPFANGPGFLRLARITLPLLLVLLVALSAGRRAYLAFRESSQIAALPAAKADAPNVLLIVLDTVRRDHVNTYGYDRPEAKTTPTIDALASRSVVFENAQTTSPWTLPSHVAMFTGRYRYQTTAGYLSMLSPDTPTLAELMAEHGYATGGFIGNIGYCSNAWGLGRGFHRYRDFPDKLTMFLSASSIGHFGLNMVYGAFFTEFKRNDAIWVRETFTDWMEGLDGKPFFAFLNFFDAHALYRPRPPYDTMFGKASENEGASSADATQFTATELQELRNSYDGLLRFIDDQLAILVEHLRTTGRLDNTILIVTADHGEQFGEHDLLSHANSLYRPLLDTPLIFHWPARLKPQRIAERVTLREMARTILQLTGAERNPFPGQTLARCFDPTVEVDPAAASPLIAEVNRGIRRPKFEPSSQGDMKSIWFGEMYYILNGDGREELYNLTDDPNEEHNLAEAPEHQEALRRGREGLRQVLRDKTPDVMPPPDKKGG